MTAVVTTADRPDLDLEVLQGDWPRFLFHDAVATEYYATAPGSTSPAAAFCCRRTTRSSPAVGVCRWTWDGGPGTVDLGRWTWDGGPLPAGYDGARAGRVITVLRERAVEDGLERVIAPVRPTPKSRCPVTPMVEFASWTRGDGLHPDPWIRTHQRLGATILEPAPRSMAVMASVAQWEDWTGMVFQAPGHT